MVDLLRGTDQKNGQLKLMVMSVGCPHNVCCDCAIDVAESYGHAKGHTTFVRPLDIASHPRYGIGFLVNEYSRDMHFIQ